MDIAVYFEKINLGNDWFSFKPVSVIRGKYDKIKNLFQTDYGVLCESINGNDPDCEDYFGFETTLEKLKKMFKELDSESTMLSEYFSIFIDRFYVGHYDYSQNKIKTLLLDFDDIQKSVSGNLTTSQSFSVDGSEAEICEDESDAEICFDIDFLKDLRNSKSMEEIHMKLDIIINMVTGQFFEDGENEMSEDNNGDHKDKMSIFKFDKITPYDILEIDEKNYTKQELSNIVIDRINKLKKAGIPVEALISEIDVILDAYNEIIKINGNSKSLRKKYY